MGQEVAAKVFSREDRQRYRSKVRACLDVFARMLSESRFDPEQRSFGLEIELNLTDDAGDPAMCNAPVLEAIADAAFQTELGQFNVEINIPPRLLERSVFEELETEIRKSLNQAEDRARGVGAHMMLIGILPTIADRHLNANAFSESSRYQLLNEQIFAARGEDLEISISGVERLQTFADTIAPEAACTSVQLHQQVEPDDFASHWNAAQVIAGIQVAVGANSPFFFGKELWRETRIALFEQATDTRPEELKAQGVRPRVWFGERWITSIFDLFEENVRYFPALLPVCEDEDPVETLERGDVPGLAELRLHNGTVYRWNRPIYDVVRGRPHVRVENRLLPAGPTRRRHPRQRGLLLRADPLADRGRAPGLVTDVVLGRRGQPALRRARRDRGARSTGRAWARCRWPSSSCAGCCRWLTRGSSGRTWPPPTASGCSASSSAAASSSRTAPPGRAPRSSACTASAASTAPTRSGS